MAPLTTIPGLPYLLTIHLLQRDTPDDTTGEVPNVESPPPPRPPPYQYPAWGTAIGCLCVVVTCLIFAFLCAGINRKTNRRKNLVSEFPVLDSKLPLIGSLAASTANLGSLPILAEHASDVGTVPPTEDKNFMKKTLARIPFSKISVRAPSKVKGWVTKKKPQEAVDGVSVAAVELKPIEMLDGTAKINQNGEGRWIQNANGDWIWATGERQPMSEIINSQGVSPRTIQGQPPREDEDNIAFITEERFENIDLENNGKK